MKSKLLFLLLSAIVLTSCSRTEIECRPVSVGEVPGRASFSWKMRDSRRDVVQKAFEIKVFAEDGALFWRSGKVESDKSLFVPYSGPELKGGAAYSWSVDVWTNKGSRPVSGCGASWFNGLYPEQWSAEWIGVDGTGKVIHDAEESLHDLSARYLRKEFNVGSGVVSATLYVCGIGSSVCYINGRRIGDDVFGPLPTWYDASVLYLTYDVSSLVKSGDNAIGVILGNGRYFGLRDSDDYGLNTKCFGFPSLLAQLLLRYEDGTEELIVSDTSWQATDRGPITRNNEFDGEHYDASLELGAWTSPDYEADSRWKAAELMTPPSGVLRAQTSPCIKVQEILEPESVRMTSDGRVLVDMGQNMVGWLKVKLRADKGSKVAIRFAETLDAEDPEQLYTANLRTAKAKDVYIPASDGEFEWEPMFVYHGFRFAEISGLDYLPKKSDFEGKVIYDDMETTGRFVTSNEILNAVYKNAYWGIRGNYRGFPTDCPQRDERYAWLGDRSTGCYGESYIFNNERLYDKWALDIEESMREDGCISDVCPRYWTIFSENVTWPATFVYVVDMLYEHFGNSEAVKARYPAMKKWVGFIVDRKMVDGTVPYDVYGDWCLPPESLELIHSQDESRKTDGEVLSTAVFYDVLCKMQKLCVVAGRPEDSVYYYDIASDIRNMYNRKFLDAERHSYANNTVTANLLSLNLGLVPENAETDVVNHIVRTTETTWNGHVGVGVMGIQHLMRGLTAHGHADLAYRIATNDTYPSLGYMYRQGATTIWELWNGNTADPAMNSGNHVMLLGDTIIWMYESLAGIRAGEPGFKAIELFPVFPEGLNSVSASYDSPYGEIVSEWRLSSGRLLWDVEIPANTRATLRVPKKFDAELKGADPSDEDDEYLYYVLGSGRYRVR